MSRGSENLSAEALLGAGALARLQQPIETASGLPNAAYCSEDFLALEQRTLFRNTWVLAGYGHDIPATGDIQPQTLAGLPIILLRDEKEKVRAFHNACRHRGTQLVAEPCSGRKRLTCPYHAWAYGLDGALLARPHFEGAGRHAKGAPDDNRLNLVPLRCETWLDFIFVNVSGDAPPLADYLQLLTDRLAGYDLASLRHAGKLDFEVQANWKLACENYVENYHVFRVHPKLIDFAPIQLRSPGEANGNCLTNEYRFPAPEEGRGAGLPHFPGLAPELQNRGVWFLMFPNFALEIFPDQLAIFQVTPLSAGRSREEIHIYLTDEALAAPELAEARQQVFDTWRDLNHEDVGVLERLQAGRRSPSFDGGVYSPHWEPLMLHFARLVAAAVQGPQP